MNTIASVRPGPRNDITDVAGISVGHAEDKNAKTGVTVILPDTPAACAVDVRGGGPGSRETDILEPETLVDHAHGVTLAGGSVYGLAAADGVAAWLGAQGRGFQLVKRPGAPPSPIVPAAILYDLANGGDKNWGLEPPYRALGVTACEGASKKAPVPLGAAGAGLGAQAGNGAGGLGSASYVTGDGFSVGAIAAVNSFGSLKMPNTDVFWAWPFEEGAEFGGRRPPADWRASPGLPPDCKPAPPKGERTNTTIAVIAVNAALTKSAAKRIAIMAQDGLARAIRPVHAPTDGDIVFCIATGEKACDDALALTRLGDLAADCLARACARGVYEAEK